MAVWRDVSLIWLIFWTLIAVLPFGLVFYFVVKGMFRLRQLARRYLPIAQKTARQVAETTDVVSRKVVAPFIAVRSARAQMQGMRNAALRRKGA